MRLRDARIEGRIGDVLLLLEHPPVITRGRRSTPEELGPGEAILREHGFDVITTQRGGLATYHGPGMLIGYPIVATPDVHDYLRRLERALIRMLADEGINAHQRESTADENLTGVWVGGPDELAGGTPPLRPDGSPVPFAGTPRKIASLGLHLSHGVSAHGFALGADNDLEPWDWFTPCGLPSVRMTSTGAETGRTGMLPRLRESAAVHVSAELGLTPVPTTRERLEAACGTLAP